MQNWLEHTRQTIQRGETLLGSSVSALFRDWQHPAVLPAMVIDKLCTGAERWQSAIRQFQPPKGLAEILRARSLCSE